MQNKNKTNKQIKYSKISKKRKKIVLVSGLCSERSTIKKQGNKEKLVKGGGHLALPVRWKPRKESMLRMDKSAVMDATNCSKEDNHKKSIMHLAKWISLLALPVEWVYDRRTALDKLYHEREQKNGTIAQREVVPRKGIVHIILPPLSLLEYLEFNMILWHRLL